MKSHMQHPDYTHLGLCGCPILPSSAVPHGSICTCNDCNRLYKSGLKVVVA